MSAKNKKNIKTQVIQIPKNLLKPVSDLLQKNLKSLERRRKNISLSDPFSSEKRVTDNAAPDTEADEQFGHATASALKDQVDRKIVQTRRALSRIRIGKYGYCEKCGEMIDTDRLMIYPEATLCIKCEGKRRK